jgi:hypothetical protein
MVYRIRYRRSGGCDDAEVVVEANSPTEAMVKFQHTWDGTSANCRDVVTSVRAEDPSCELSS